MVEVELGELRDQSALEASLDGEDGGDEAGEGSLGEGAVVDDVEGWWG